MNESYRAGDHGLPPLGQVTWLYLLFYSPYNILGGMVDQYAMTLSCNITMTSQPLAHVTVIFGFISTFIRPVITKFGKIINPPCTDLIVQVIKMSVALSPFL